jgi:hypothetical protein
VIYRPSNSKTDVFLSQFSNWLEVFLALPGRLLIMGDFDVHIDIVSCSFGKRFLSMGES